ncbi:complement C1q-like protein 4 [Mercenaria mercenaria]|uniref:complement C1q-like protein 4 n=1 Tax=Mercenaria mercenaria TaxID=6596 RepID=UPI00234E65DC|nr:complement C1q-like protein 4 [Mercenaria mercenaria]
MFNFKIYTYLLFLVLFYVECRSAPEPLCSKFSYDEQLLEKMVRVEFNVNNMEKNMLETEQNMRETEQNMKETEKNMLETQRGMLETQKNMLKSLNEIEDKIKVLEQKEAPAGKDVVAFHAYKAADKTLANNQVIVFTKVIMNEGDGYSSSNGYFTAPISGIFYFNAHLCVQNGKSLEYIIVVNGQTRASGLYKANASGTCTSFSVTAHMRSGERAWVTIDKSGSSSSSLLYEDSDDWNYFSGFLIRQLD